MKKWIYSLAMALMATGAFAQSDTPAYKRNPTLPALNLLNADSTALNTASLKNQPVILMYFSPTCDHCKQQMADMLKRMDDLGKYQLVLATYQPLADMKHFYSDYKLSQYHNITIGRDAQFKLPPFFQIRSLPYLALYDKKHQLITTYEGNVTVEKILKSFEQH